MFGLFKKQFPVLTTEMLEPVDVPISTANAKKIFVLWMVKIGYLDREEALHQVRYLAEEMKDHEDYLRLERDSKRDELKDAKDEHKSEVATLRSEIAQKQKELVELRIAAKDQAVDPKLAKAELFEAESELTNLKSDLQVLISNQSEQTRSWLAQPSKIPEFWYRETADMTEVEIAQVSLKIAEIKLDAFKKDKRSFLVQYINSQVHGHSRDASR